MKLADEKDKTRHKNPPGRQVSEGVREGREKSRQDKTRHKRSHGK